MADGTLAVAALKCTISSVACRSIFMMTYWSDFLDKVIPNPCTLGRMVFA